MAAGYRPGRLAPWWPLATAGYYLHVGLATLVLGLWGLPKALIGGRAGAQRVATVWIAHMLRAARWHFGVRVEVRGTPPAAYRRGQTSELSGHPGHRAGLPRARLQKRKSCACRSWYARQVGSVPIDRTRGRDARSAMIEAVRGALSRGLGQLIIYPEGTRTRPGQRRPWKAGVVTLVQETGLPCYPVATNAGMFWPKEGLRIRPGVAVIEFLPPLPGGNPGEGLLADLEARVEDASDALMAEAGLNLPAR